MNGMEEFKDLYLQTARERIQQLNDLLLKLEQDPNQTELIQELMRAGHSLKGESGAMGYTNIATLAHVIEDLFTAIGNGQKAVNTAIMDALLGSIDQIEACVESITTKDQEIDLTEPTNHLKEITGLKTEGFGKSDKNKPAETPAATPAADATSTTTATETSPAKPDVETPATQPAATPAATAVSSSNQTVKSEKISTVTFKVEKLDQLISISEELVLSKMKLRTNQLIETDSNLKAEINKLDRLVTDLQFHIMQARLFPISLALHTLPRLARDTSKKTGKDVRLEMEGEDTTVDRTIIDHLTEPFVHMIRNAIDHGLETPEERVKIGKPAQAVIKIKAYTKENKFYVEIADDGRGIEWEKVVKAAIKKGFVKAEEVAEWSQKQIEQLLFKGGVSTNEVVTDVSGRGVGMAAVNEAIRKLGGTLEIKTKVGQGTTFVLRLPLTLAIMQALLIKVTTHIYALPANEVVRSIQIDKSQLQHSANSPVIVVDKLRVPVFDLAVLFGHRTSTTSLVDGTTTPSGEVSSQMTVILVKQDNDVIGCVVDKITAEEEILVKPLGPLLKQSNYFSGATILANGAAAPIINVEGLKWKPTLS